MKMIGLKITGVGVATWCMEQVGIYEPVREKTNNLGFRPGPTQTSLYSHRRNPES